MVIYNIFCIVVFEFLYKFKLDFGTPQFSRLIAFYVYLRLEANIALSFNDNLDQTPYLKLIMISIANK